MIFFIFVNIKHGKVLNNPINIKPVFGSVG